MAETIRVGIVGLLGKMGGIRASEIQRSPHMELVIGADPAIREGPGGPVECSADYRDVVAADLDAIVVCTPNNVAVDVVCAGLDAGKHVFCEKPPGRSVADVERIMAAERRNPGLKLKFGFNHRYHSGIQEAKRIIDSGRLGDILWLRGVYGKAGGDEFEQSWRNQHDISGGGILLDQGIHMLDLFRHFCGEFDEVKSMVTTAFWDVDVEDNAFALLRDHQGRIAMLHSSSTQWKHRFNLEIYTSSGYLSVNGILSSTRSYGDESITMARRAHDSSFATGKPREEVLYFDTDPSWELELQDFAESILEDRPIQVGSSKDAYESMRLVEAIYRADDWIASDRGDQSATAELSAHHE